MHQIFIIQKNLKIKKIIISIKCDLNNLTKLRKIIHNYKPSAIFNVAAETHVDRSIEGPKNFIYYVILLELFHILEIIRKYKGK